MRLRDALPFHLRSGPSARSPESSMIHQTRQEGQTLGAGTLNVLALVTVSVLTLLTWSSLYL